MLLQKYCSLLKDLSIAIDDDNKIISIKLKLKNKTKPLLFIGLYRVPNSDINLFNDSFFFKFKYINTDIFICGDFNIEF